MKRVKIGHSKTHFNCTICEVDAALTCKNGNFFLKNGPNPASFSFIFGLFQTNNTIFTTNQCEKCHVHPVSGARIRTHDLWNVSLLPKPLDQGSRPTLLILSMMTEDVTERKKGVGGIKDTCSLPFKTELNYNFA